MSESLTQRVEIVGQDQASAAIRDVISTLGKLDAQARRTSETLARAFGGDIAKQFAKLKNDATAFGSDLAESAATAAKALKADVAAATELRETLQSVVSEQRAMAEAVRSTMTASAAASTAEARQTRTAATGRARASRDQYRDIRSNWNIRARSEKAELDHVKALRQERASLRREVARSARETVSRGHHAIKRLNHPVYESAGLYAAAGAVGAVEAAKRTIEASVSLDTAVTRLKMFAPSIDVGQARKQALTDSISMGMDASKVIDVQAKAIRDGVAPEIARSLPKGIAAAAQVMGGDVEKLTDSLAEGIQESAKMGWIKNGADARRYLNLEAGLSNFGGNTSEKMEEFVAAGGLGHGKELGLGMTGSMAYGALLNSSGMRTGLASARFLGQLSQNVPKMFDRYRSAIDSHKNSEEDRAVRSAPSRLGFGSVKEMQARILAGPEGLIDFATRLQRLDDKARKLTLEGFGFSEQGGAALAEIGAGPDKAKAVLQRAKDLAAQKEANDYLSEKFAQWQTSLANMLKQIEAGWRAIESEVGDVLKTDIIAPLRDWWVMLSAAIVNSDLKDKIHGAIIGFVNGLGFDDVKALLDSLTANVHGFDFAVFAKGLGEGVRNVADAFGHLGGVLGGMGGDPETIGKLAAELMGLSLASHLMSPVLGIIGSMASSFLALKAALDLGGALLKLSGIADSLKAIAGVELATTATSMLAVAGGLTAIGVAIEGLMAAGVLQRFHMPKDTSADEMDKFLWGAKPDGTSARPAWVDRLTGGDTRAATPESDAYWQKKKKFLHLNSFEDDGSGFGNLLTKTSYSPSDSGEVVKDAMVDSSRTIIEVRDELIETNRLLKTSALPSLDVGYGGGGGSGGGAANFRYGRNAAGGRNSTPGTGSFGNPSKSLLDYIAKSEGGGYNVSWGNGRFLPGGKETNLTGKSLNEILALGQYMRQQPGSKNSSALGRYQITGSTIRDLMKRLNLTGNEKFDEAMQDRLASKLIADEGPRALQRWESLKSGGRMQTALGLLRSGQIASQPNATGPAMPLSGDLGERLGSLKKAGLISDEQCVSLSMGVVGIRKGAGAGGNVHQWLKGAGAADGTLLPGTPVATFLNRDGSQSDRYAGGGSGTPGAGLDHAGVFEKYLLDGGGKRIGMMLAEQYAGSHGIHDRAYYFSRGRGEADGANYHAVLGSDGKPLGGDSNPMTVRIDPKSIASHVTGVTTPQSDSGKGAASVDQSMTNHITIHHNGGDPRATAGAITAQLDRWHSKTMDVDPFA